jgi:hypothetical protein
MLGHFGGIPILSWEKDSFADFFNTLLGSSQGIPCHHATRLLSATFTNRSNRKKSWNTKTFSATLRAGVPGATRTRDRRIRNPVLYPAELPGQAENIYKTRALSLLAFSFAMGQIACCAKFVPSVFK